MAKGKKSANGTGSVWRRKDGRYSAAITYPYHRDGVTHRKRAQTTKSTWEAAHRWLMERQRDLLGGVQSSPDNPRVGEYLDMWLSEVVEPSVAPKTYEKREYHVHSHIAPGLGNVRLKELSPRRIHLFYSHLARRDPALATSTRRDIHATLKMALKQAVRWGMVPSNPCELVDPPKPLPDEMGDEAEEVRALTDGQAKVLFTSTRGQRWHCYYVTAIRTGLRPGELLGLQWGDVDLSGDPASLRVRRTLGIRQGGGTYTKRPKSEAGRRGVALHWEAAEALQNQNAMLESEGHKRGPKDLVFPSATGSPMDRGNLLRRHLKADLAAAGLPELTLHELRHSYASIALYEWRLPAEIVQESLGHTSLRMTVDLYGHLMPNAQADAMRRINEMYRRPNTESGTKTGT